MCITRKINTNCFESSVDWFFVFADVVSGVMINDFRPKVFGLHPTKDHMAPDEAMLLRSSLLRFTQDA
jgi:hypothetical protein